MVKTSFGDDILSKIAVRTKKERRIFNHPRDFIEARMPEYFMDRGFYEHQERIWDHIQKNKRSLILVPRGHFKSELLTFLLPMIQIENDKNTRMLVVRENQALADGAVRRIKKLYESDPERFGIGMSYPWTDGVITVNRTSNWLTESTLTGCGWDAGITGGHFEWLLFDDVVSDKNSSTDHNRNLMSETFSTTYVPMNTGEDTRYVVIGTYKHNDDLYHRLEKTGGWAVLKLHAITRHGKPEVPPYKFVKDDLNRVVDIEFDCPPDELAEYEVLCPEVRPLKYLIEQMLIMPGGLQSWMMEYQLQTPNPDTSPFDPKWLDGCYYTLDELPPISELHIFQGIDLASTDKKHSTHSVILTVGIHIKDGVQVAAYLLDIFKQKIDPWRATDVMKERWIKWRPIRIWTEANAHQRIVTSWANETSMMPMFPTYTEVSKQDRMIKLAPLFQLGKIKLLREMTDVVAEYVEFDPSDKNPRVDVLDALEFICRNEMDGYAGKSISADDFSFMMMDNTPQFMLHERTPGIISSHTEPRTFF